MFGSGAGLTEITLVDTVVVVVIKTMISIVLVTTGTAVTHYARGMTKASALSVPLLKNKMRVIL